MMTFLAPPPKWRPAFSFPVKTPVDSQTMSAPAWPHGMLAGSFSAKILIFLPLTTRQPSSALTSP